MNTGTLTSLWAIAALICVRTFRFSSSPLILNGFLDHGLAYDFLVHHVLRLDLQMYVDMPPYSHLADCFPTVYVNSLLAT